MKLKDDVVGYCPCGAEILVNEEHIEVNGELICKHCVHNYNYAEWMDLLHINWQTSSIPHSEVLREMMEE